ncbi:hypothetical protein [Megalodesulfovibrio paquesii]
MSSKSYNVILMRDDAHVRRLRIKPIWLKLAVYLLACIVLVAAVSCWLVVKLWSEHGALMDETLMLRRQAHENTVELQRLKNMERMLKSADPLGQQSVLENLMDPSGEAAQSGDSSGVDLNALLGEKNTGRAVIKRVSLSQGDLVWKLSFELSNPDQQHALEGHYLIQIVGTDAQNHAVTLEKELTQFQISRFKKIEVEFTPPSDLPASEIFGLRLTIDQKDGPTIYSKVWQISSILSVS